MHIEDRTKQFITEYNRLKKEGRIESQSEIANLFGLEGKTSISNILNLNQNIKPAHWELFKKEFGIKNVQSSPLNNEPLEKKDDKYIAVLEERIQELKEDKDWLKRTLETSLGRVAIVASSALAHIDVSLDQDIDREAKGDKAKAKRLRQETDKRIADKMTALVSKGN